MAETKREAQGIAGLRGYSAYQEALEVILQVSWLLCSLRTPSIRPMTPFIVDLLSNLRKFFYLDIG